MLAVRFVGFEGHTCLRPLHYHAAFGIEVHYGRSFLHLRTEITHVRTLRHVVVIDTRSCGLVVKRKYAAIEFLVVAVELLSHLLVEEPLLSRPGMGMLVLAPVQLPSGIGPQLVEASVEGIVQDEGASALPILQLHEMTLQHVAFLVPEFRIEQLAQVGQPASIASAHICLEEQRVAGKVAGIVHVHEHFLLRYVPAEEVEVLLPSFQR